VKWVWITRTSTIDKEGNLGFLASTVDVPRFGARARKVLLRLSPSTLQESFVGVVMNPDRPWKRRAVDGRENV
jgi:hypothetical protein